MDTKFMFISKIPSYKLAISESSAFILKYKDQIHVYIM